MENRVLTINDILNVDGLYEGFLVSSNKMYAFILIEALNLDLEDDFVIKNVLKSYGAFLNVLKSRNESIMNITMTAKNNTEQYELYWKYKLLEVDKRSDIDEAAKQNIKQLIASKILDIEQHVRQNESITKQHFMVLSEKIEGKSYEDYEAASSNLLEKTNTIISEMQEWLRNCNRDVSVKLADNKETLQILQHFIDNKAAMLN